MPQNILGNYKLVLGLEIHIHVNTERKMFCGCEAKFYGEKPNTHACPVCLGLPGALPVPNLEAIKKTQLLGLALNCQLREDSKFDRKHYFYPDLPKGYQISQYKEPLCENGFMELPSGERAEIERIHLEEDTAKSMHEGNKTLIDFNKSGMPLMELVTQPCFTSVEDAVYFARKIRDIARHLGVSDADMEKGQMRIEPNISLRTAEMETKNELPDYKVEVKNINSFKFMEKAVISEIKRQKKALEEGIVLKQENRGYDENSNSTKAQRSKEDAKDYRYFPEPDIPPLEFSEEYFEELKEILPELPDEIREKLINKYALPDQYADELIKGENISLLQKFEELVVENIEPQKVANLLLNKKEMRDLSSEEFKAAIAEMEDKVDDADALEKLVIETLSENKKAVEDFKNGKDSVLQFLLGMVMKKTKGKADPKLTMQLLKSKLA
ncbi:MAG: Asp-tRNA(Asn)/Glu-tRNA(Gln) amidotransferase subunit GatB [Patescibacteria group bacterium]